MAEYIDKQIILDKCQRLIDVERKQGSDVMNYGRERVNQTEVIMEYIEYMTPTADVIERSEYNEMHEKYLKAIHDHTKCLKELHEYRSKIDKSIEEIHGYLTTKPSNNQWIDGINYALEILKRNIGE